MNDLFQLVWRFVYFSLISFGAGFAIIIPQIHEHFVNQLHWLTDAQFTETVAVSQASPGPNFQMVPLIGWRAAGLPGALVALVAFLAIPSTLAIIVGRAVRNASENKTVILLQRALRPVSCGLWFASGIGLGRTVDHHAVQIGLSIAIALLSAFVDVNPLWWLFGAGIIGAVFV
jgi:chromate transporter